MKALKKLNKTKTDLSNLQAERKLQEKNINKLINKNLDLENRQEKIDKGILVLQLLVENKKREIIDTFEETVTSALQEIFNKEYSFKIEFSKRNKVTTADFVINTGEYAGFMPLKMCQGKSVARIIAFVLRTMFVSILDGRKLMVLDECFDGVEWERQSKVGNFISKLCEKYNMQIIMVTHMKGIYEHADKVHRL